MRGWCFGEASSPGSSTWASADEHIPACLQRRRASRGGVKPVLPPVCPPHPADPVALVAPRIGAGAWPMVRPRAGGAPHGVCFTSCERSGDWNGCAMRTRPLSGAGRLRKTWWHKMGTAALVRLLLIVALLGIRVGDAIHPGPTSAEWGFDDSDMEFGCYSSDVDDGDDQGGEPSVMPASAVDADVYPDVVERTWTEYERQFHLGANRTRPLRRQNATLPPTPDASGFMPAKMFAGSIVGHYFGTGNEGIGYYQDTGRAPPRVLELAPLVAADLWPLACSSAPRKPRARRARHPDGRSKAKHFGKLIRQKRMDLVSSGPLKPHADVGAVDAIGLDAKVRTWAFDTANASSLESLRGSVLARTAADGVFFQEARVLGDDAVAAAVKRLHGEGWNAHMTAAHRTAANRGSGGVGVSMRGGVGVSPHAGVVPPPFAHRIAIAWVGGLMRGGFPCCFHLFTAFGRDV